MLCCVADDRNTQLEEMVSNIEFINKRILALLDECSSLKDVIRLLKIWSLDVYQMQQIL